MTSTANNGILWVNFTNFLMHYVCKLHLLANPIYDTYELAINSRGKKAYKSCFEIWVNIDEWPLNNRILTLWYLLKLEKLQKLVLLKETVNYSNLFRSGHFGKYFCLSELGYHPPVWRNKQFDRTPYSEVLTREAKNIFFCLDFDL